MSADIPKESKITIDTVVRFIKENPDKIKLIDFLWLLKQEKYSHLATEILNLTFSEFIGKSLQINEQNQCEKEIVKLYGKLNNLGITEIQKLLGNCDRFILIKAIKLLERKNYTGYRIKYIGKRKGRKYTLLKDEECENLTDEINEKDEDDDEDFDF